MDLRDEDLEWWLWDAIERSCGGQHTNGSSGAILLLHKPSGIAVKVDEGRSQMTNKAVARKRLAEILETLDTAAKST